MIISIAIDEPSVRIEVMYAQNLQAASKECLSAANFLIFFFNFKVFIDRFYQLGCALDLTNN